MRCFRKQLGRGLGVADDFGDVEVGDGEASTDQRAGCGECAIENGEWRADGFDAGIGNGCDAFGRRLADAMIENIEGVPFDAGRGP